ncbi:MAG: hypothetical protein WC882_01530 [Candidatus Gracilibacteria bacterium]
MIKNIKVSRAWIVTYQSYNRYKKLNNKVLSVLKWQKSLKQIVEHLTQLYVDNRLSPSEKIGFLRNRNCEGLAYGPKINRTKNNTDIITIGHDPILEARQVKNLEVKDEKWSWEEI